VYPENALPALDELDTALRGNPSITMVAAVHCETTTGILNPVEAIGSIVAQHKRQYFVDAMSSFGGIPLDMAAANVTYLVSSANKCIEGVPGFSFVLARRDALLATEGYARTLTLDLLAQWRGLETNGQFRFTPPVQVMLAFHQALVELEEEGGVTARGERYRANHQTLIAGMREMGFREYVDPAHQSYIITTFLYPDDPSFHFETFYRKLSEKGYVIYPGKLTHADCFRIGTVGHLYQADIQALLDGIRQTCEEVGLRYPVH
jgi:2-aminoethylphosphonate-pyruvate transaminase